MARHHTASIVAVAAVLMSAIAFPATVDAGRAIVNKSGSRFVVQGRVFCDTCRAGFETPATTYMAGASVRVECRSRTNGATTYSIEGVTDKTGTYNIPVHGEHEHESCEALLVSSRHSKCNTVVPGRERAPVFLTQNNGIASETRFANSLGFQAESVLADCAELMKTYEETEV